MARFRWRAPYRWSASLFKQELPSFVRHSKQEWAGRRIRYALLHLPQLNLKHFLKFVVLQWVKHHH